MLFSLPEGAAHAIQIASGYYLRQQETLVFWCVMSLQKKRVQKSFSRCAQRYENNALLQKEIAQQLVERQRISSRASIPAKILEAGVGTGYLSQLLRQQIPTAQIIAFDLAFGMLKVAQQKKIPHFHLMAADAEYLPYQDNCFDLVISSLTYQWIDRLKHALSEIHRILKPGAQLYIATLGPASLQELRNSFTQAYQMIKGNCPNYLQEFPAAEQINIFLNQTGFTNIIVESQLIRKFYPSPNLLLRTLQEIGASNASKKRPRGLASRKVLQHMEQFYRQTYSSPEGIWASYEIICVQASRCM